MIIWTGHTWFHVLAWPGFSASGFKVVGNIDCLGSVFSQDPQLVHVHVSVCGSWVIVYANTASHSITAP